MYMYVCTNVPQVAQKSPEGVLVEEEDFHLSSLLVVPEVAQGFKQVVHAEEKKWLTVSSLYWVPDWTGTFVGTGGTGSTSSALA